MFDILSVIPSRKRNTPSGWITFNCVCCVHQGHNADKRNRGGLKFDGQYSWTYNCFNCNYRCGFTLGKPIPQKTRQMLQWCGIDDEQIGRWNLQSLEQRDLLDILLDVPVRKKIEFETRELPAGAQLLDPTNRVHHQYINYLHSRGFKHTDYPFMVTPQDAGRNSNRIIVPYTYKNKIVGHTSRYRDDKKPKYINEQQPGYVFGVDLQKPEYSIAIVVEGIFDALSINGLAVMHSDISPDQAHLINSLNRRVIVVPDQDSSGIDMCDRALEYGYSVSIPPWHYTVKDVNDAVRRYGKVATLLSIIQYATTSKIKIEMRRRRISAK